MNNYIYVGGGVVDNNEQNNTVERYDLLSDSWECLPSCKLPRRMFAMTFLAVRKRYIYSFGEARSVFIEKSRDVETFYKLDTLNLSQGWLKKEVKSPYKC